MKFQTLSLYLFDRNSNQSILKVKTEKPKTENIRGIQDFILNLLVYGTIQYSTKVVAHYIQVIWLFYGVSVGGSFRGV